MNLLHFKWLDGRQDENERLASCCKELGTDADKGTATAKETAIHHFRRIPETGYDLTGRTAEED